MEGFKIYSTDDGRVPVFEFMPASTIKPEIGMALSMEGGVLVKATGADAPAYVSMCQKETACKDGENIPVIRVQPDIVFCATSEENLAAVSIGDKLTISADAMGVTATTGGSAEVVGKDESGVRVRFV